MKRMSHRKIIAIGISFSMFLSFAGCQKSEKVDQPGVTGSVKEENVLLAEPVTTVIPEPTVTAVLLPTEEPEVIVTPEPVMTPEVTVSPEVAPKPTATPKPTVTPKPTSTPKPISTPKPEETNEKNVLKLVIDSVQLYDNLSWEIMDEYGTVYCYEYGTPTLFGEFSWSGELTEEKLNAFSYVAMLSDAKGNRMRTESFVCDGYSRRFSADLPKLPAGTYTLELTAFYEYEEYKTKVTFIFEDASNEDMATEITNKIPYIPRPTITPKPIPDKFMLDGEVGELELIIDSIQVVDNVKLNYKTRYGDINYILDFGSTSVYGTFLWSRKLTEEERYSKTSCGAVIYDEYGKVIQLASSWVNEYDSRFAGMLPELPKGTYTYELYGTIGETSFSGKASFILNEDLKY